MKKITVYTKNGCQPCRITKKKLTEMDIEFTEINCDQQPEAIEQLRLYGYQTLPVVAIGSLDNSWAGLRPNRLRELAK